MPRSPEEFLEERLNTALDEYCSDKERTRSTLPAIPPGSDIVNYLFRNWYRPTTFIFRKNIKITNVQYSELLALISLNSTRLHQDGPNRALGSHLYERSKDMKLVFVSLWDAQTTPLLIDQEQTNALKLIDSFVHTFSRRYGALFADTILLDAYASSAQIFTSPLLELHLADICAQSGYIYACGYTIYIRRSGKVEIPKLREKTAQWIQNHARQFTSIPFFIYSKEQFPLRASPDEVRNEQNGLDDLKFHLDKFYFGQAPVSDLHRELISDRSIEMEILRLGERLKVNLSHVKRLKLMESRHDTYRPPDSALPGDTPSVWMLMDRPIDFSEPLKPSDRYFVCFVQEYRNTHQLFEIDEAKPGWTQPVTLPHTLTSAMFNIARAGIPADVETIRVLDPFFGCGTTFIESNKIPNRLDFVGFDKYPPNIAAFNLNWNFLCLTVEQKRSLADQILDLIRPIAPEEAWTDAAAALLALARKGTDYDLKKNMSSLNPRRKDIPTSFTDKFKRAEARAEKMFQTALDQAVVNDWSFGAIKQVASFAFPHEALSYLQKGTSTIEEQFLFFVCWKAFISNIYRFFSFDGNPADLKLEVILSELGKTYYRLQRIIQIEASPPVEPSGSALAMPKTRGIELCRGVYSPKTRTRFVEKDSAFTSTLAVKDIKDLEPFEGHEKFHIIISDPPYGFNVGEGPDDSLPDLFTKFIDLSLCSVVDGGQIICCVPVRPMNGQIIPYFMQADFIMREFVLCAKKNNKKLRIPATRWPANADRFLTPYYWESERALRRAVLHFQVFD